MGERSMPEAGAVYYYHLFILYYTHAWMKYNCVLKSFFNPFSALCSERGISLLTLISFFLFFFLAKVTNGSDAQLNYIHSQYFCFSPPHLKRKGRWCLVDPINFFFAKSLRV